MALPPTLPDAAPAVNQPPPEVRDIGVDEKLGGAIPLDAKFTDETGKKVSLSDYFAAGRPVILQLGYFGCPMLCGEVSKGLVNSLNELPLTMGKDYEVLNVSFDPDEGPDLAARKKTSFLEAYKHPSGAQAWHFLTGDKESIRRLTESVGFRYKWVADQQQFAHAAVLMIVSPGGSVSRYLYGVGFDPKTMRLALVEASQGKVGTTADKFLMTCLLSYNKAAGRYTVAAVTLMRVAAVACVLLLAAILTTLFVREMRSRKKLATG